MRRLPDLVLAAACIVAYFITYRLLSGTVRIIWSDWADQSFYIRSAHAFAALDLSADRHWYPLLYPLVAAPLAVLPPWLDFGIIDFTCLLVTWAGFARVAEQFGVSRWPALAIFTATTLLMPKIVDQWLLPWTTTLSAALIWQGLADTLETAVPRRAALIGPRASARAPARLGLLLALIPLARPSDGIVSLVLAVFAAAAYARRGERAALISAAAAGGGALVAYAALHVAIYGVVTTPYMRLSRAFGLDVGQLGWKSYILLVEPRPWYPQGHGLLQSYPWLLLGGAGLVIAMMQPRRHAALCLGATMLSYLFVMLAYVDLLPSGLWRYNNVHYFKWLLPGFGLFAVSYIRALRDQPARSLAVLGMLVLTSSIRLMPMLAPPSAPARLLVFAAPERDFPTIYRGWSTIVDGRGPLRNFYEYHQIPDGRGAVHALALRRDFAGGEQWLSRAPADTDWPADAPHPHAPPVLAGPYTRRPLGRFAPSASLGWPCWWYTSPCAGGRPE